MSQVQYWERYDRAGYYAPPSKPERTPDPAPVGSLAKNLGMAQSPCLIGENQIKFTLRHVTQGNFKEFYRAAVPNTDGEHTVILINTTWVGCGPEELDGEQVVVRVKKAAITHWRFLDSRQWNEYDE